VWLDGEAADLALYMNDRGLLLLLSRCVPDSVPAALEYSRVIRNAFQLGTNWAQTWVLYSIV
jgi:hypothetical protein